MVKNSKIGKISMKLLKKLLKLLTILSLLFLTISCNEEMSKFLFVIDNSENVEWKQDEFINPIKDFLVQF